MIALTRLDRLRTAAGTALLAAIREAAPTPATELAVISRLRPAFPDQTDLIAPAMTLHQLRERARDKFSRADEMWFTRDGYEQATSERIARYRAARFAGRRRVFDLCCGIGGDLLGLAMLAEPTGGDKLRPYASGIGGDLIALASVPAIEEVVAVDRDPVHLAMAELNAHIYNPAARVTPLLAEVESVDLTGAEGAFIDPARRDERGRLATGRSEPALDWCLGLTGQVPAVGIKTAPGLPRHLVPDDWELETIALRTELKEAVLWSPALRRSSRRATVIAGDTVHSLVPVTGDAVPVQAPVAGDVLYDPNPAVTRAGLVDDLARLLNAAKIDDQIGFLLITRPVETPFARGLTVLASLPWHERRVMAQLRDLGGGEVTIRRRGLAGEVDAIQRRLRGSGARPLFVAMTRLNDRPWAIVCDDAAPSQRGDGW